MSTERDWGFQLLIFYTFSAGFTVYYQYFESCVISLQSYFASTALVITLGLISNFFVDFQTCKPFWTKIRFCFFVLILLMVSFTTPILFLVVAFDSSCIDNQGFFYAVLSIYGIIDLSMYAYCLLQMVFLYMRYRNFMSKTKFPHRIKKFYKLIYKKTQKQIEKFISRYRQILQNNVFTLIEKVVLKDRYSIEVLSGQLGLEDHEKDSCSICLSDFDVKDQVTVHPHCKHAFHFRCLVRWLKESNRCPLCKSNTRIQMLRCFHDKEVTTSKAKRFLNLATSPIIRYG